MEAEKKKAVVTGGAGFIGSHLANTLSDNGFQVTALDIAQDTRGRLHTDVAFEVCDVRDTTALARIFAGAQYIFHTAALPRVQYSIEHPRETNEVNVGGIVNVLTAAQEAKVARVVYSSSSSIYGEQDSLPFIESMQAHPKSPYGLQKYIGELYCSVFSEVYNLQTVSLRYFNVYGPGDDPHSAYALVIPKFLEMRVQNKALTITGDGTQTRDFTHVRDVVRANLLAAQSPSVGNGESLNIGAGNNVSINRIAELVGGPTQYIAPRYEPHDTKADNALAKKLLGWEPHISIEEGIAELKKLSGLQ
ncbi:NAD-dependent epimerase/dehydratase family protein [Acetobacteraceae bacterium]|nr:NAD-dependent epimerase/dehydratase family protein [Candidatus Parcubacteria bacterium]